MLNEQYQFFNLVHVGFERNLVCLSRTNEFLPSKWEKFWTWKQVRGSEYKQNFRLTKKSGFKLKAVNREKY